MSSFTQLYNKLKGTNTAKIVGYTYAAFVAYGLMRGACSGFGEFLTWRATRKEITVNNNLYDPVLNVCRDTGIAGFNMMAGGFGSAVIVATAPVSIPMLSYLSEEKD
jgi:hypothetical protein